MHLGGSVLMSAIYFEMHQDGDRVGIFRPEIKNRFLVLALSADRSGSAGLLHPTCLPTTSWEQNMEEYMHQREGLEPVLPFEAK